MGRTDWMLGGWGIMVHWIAPGPPPENGAYRMDLNDAVDSFDVPRFLEDFAATGADWLIFTVGQNTGYYVSPNRLLDEWAGPGHCSERDLIQELMDGVTAQGKRFIAYLTCEVESNTTLHQAFGWNTEEGTDQTVFQKRYTQFVGEWAKRWGRQCSGWWIDGCFTWNIFANKYMDWPLWFAAGREGNPDSVLAFNDGSFCVGNTQPVTMVQDYLSGEVEVLHDGKIRLGRSMTPVYHMPTSRFVEGTQCQWHALVPIDAVWAHGVPPTGVFGERFATPPQSEIFPMEKPVYSDDELANFLESCLPVGGAVTFNVGIYQEGHLGPETIAQLQRIRNRIIG